MVNERAKTFADFGLFSSFFHQIMLPKVSYFLILLLLASKLATTTRSVVVLVVLRVLGYKGIRLCRLIATYTFSGIIEKTDNTRWLLRKVDFTDEAKPAKICGFY